MSHVFISYSRADYDTAQQLARALQQSRIPVWWDPEIALGEQWQPAIENAIFNAAAVVILWSRNAIQSEWVYREAALANEQGTMVPVRIDGVQPPGEFGAYDAADLSDWDPRRPHREFDQLRRYLFSLFDRDASWQVERLDQETLRVSLSHEEHTVSYSRGHLYVDGEMAVQGVAMVVNPRSFNFELTDGGDYYPARLEVYVSAFRGSVKRLIFSVGGNALYDG